MIVDEMCTPHRIMCRKFWWWASPEGIALFDCLWESGGEVLALLIAMLLCSNVANRFLLGVSAMWPEGERARIDPAQRPDAGLDDRGI